jgi:hypothetical protein
MKGLKLSGTSAQGSHTMRETFTKLNFRAQNPILVLFAPGSFAAELADMAASAPETAIHSQPEPNRRYSFILAFGAMKTDLLAAVNLVLPHLASGEPNHILWLAYPKQTSKLFSSDVNRDSLWKIMEPFGLTPNRQIAIDEDWSALRFKRG